MLQTLGATYCVVLMCYMVLYSRLGGDLVHNVAVRGLKIRCQQFVFFILT